MFSIPGQRWNPYWSGPSLIQFLGVREAAANIAFRPNTHLYTIEMFLADFPQFGKVVEDDSTDPPTTSIEPVIPEGILQIFINMANSAIHEEVWGPSWRYACGLFVAHYATLYLQSYAPSTPENDPGTGAGSGQIMGLTTSAKLGDASINYDVAAITAGTESWGAWNSTSYGQLLITMAIPLVAGGMYAI